MQTERKNCATSDNLRHVSQPKIRQLKHALKYVNSARGGYFTKVTIYANQIYAFSAQNAQKVPKFWSKKGVKLFSKTNRLHVLDQNGKISVQAWSKLKLHNYYLILNLDHFFNFSRVTHTNKKFTHVIKFYGRC